ncbi:MAG: hypothetical protein IPK82_19145 [Polyangiaceae bacterium]|nr:hypothetical protein [Polyangiaceae bacterium]
MTIADAAAKSGLPLWDAERGLHALVSEYRGHLRVTEKGELLFRFPHGLTKPWVTQTAISKVFSTIGAALLAVARFVVRAWLTIVLVTYVVVFILILIAIVVGLFSGKGRGGKSAGGALNLFGGLFRLVAEALYWMFHPATRFYNSRYSYYTPGVGAWDSAASSRQSSHAPSPFVAGAPPSDAPKVPFYEKVNRFFFGPDEPPQDERALEKKVIAEIRAQKGRIGLSDVMRVTGLPRDTADPLMSRLMLEYDGNVAVSEEGGIVYTFANIRRTADDPELASEPRPASVWDADKGLLPFTGNPFGSNMLIILMNGFNLIMAYWAYSNNWTIERLTQMFQGLPPEQWAPPTTAWVLGVVPLVFSIALFALPLFRALWRPFKARRVAREQGRKALVRAILERVQQKRSIRETELAGAWAAAAGDLPDSKVIQREVVALGGDVDMEQTEDGVRYRFPDLEAESRALAAEREAAAEDEAHVGKVVFDSEEPVR